MIQDFKIHAGLSVHLQAGVSYEMDTPALYGVLILKELTYNRHRSIDMHYSVFEAINKELPDMSVGHVLRVHTQHTINGHNVFMVYKPANKMDGHTIVIMSHDDQNYACEDVICFAPKEWEEVVKVYKANKGKFP